MIQKCYVRYGFTQLQLDYLKHIFYVIKLKFDQSAVDESMSKFFKDLGFTERLVWHTNQKHHIIFQYFVCCNTKKIDTSNYRAYQETAKKVREYLVNNNIPDTYNQFAENC